MIFEELSQVLDPEPHAGAYNMALDEVLLRPATAPILRIYRWSRPAVSFGYFQKGAEVERRWSKRELVRRWTGGGVVPHGQDLTYTLIVPAGGPLLAKAPADCYRLIHEVIARVLSEMGEELTLSTGAEKISEECFANPAPHDVMAGGTKIAGAAQRRTRHGLLHQGSIQRAGLAAEFGTRFAEALARRVTSRGVTEEEDAEAQQLAREKYGTAEWLRRY